ncbi:MAG: hypothetical protein H0Z53_04955 [Nitrosospira sp.]|nr:hypothetical protein [Nitrosospira sp.]
MREVETATTKKLIRRSKKNVAGKSTPSSPDQPAPKNSRDASPIPKLNTENKLFRVELSGYGAELVYGNITKQQYEYWIDKELDDLIGDWNNEIEISEDFRFIKNGDWVECDNLIHRHACEFSEESKLIVYSEDGVEILNISLVEDVLTDAEINIENDITFRLSDHDDSPYIFHGVRYEKGTFFECNLELNEEFNPAMLTLIMDDLEEQRYVNGLTYNGVSAENIGGDTRDTSSMFSVYNVNNIS